MALSVQESELIVSGMVVALKADTGFDSRDEAGRPTDRHKEPDGSWKVTLVTEEGGFAVVKLKEDDFDLYRPVKGDEVVWWVRLSPWKMPNGNSGMSNVFTRAVQAEDLDALTLKLDTVAVPA